MVQHACNEDQSIERRRRDEFRHVARRLLPACDSGWDFECEEHNPVDVTIHFVDLDDFVGRELFFPVTGSANWNPPEPDPHDEIFRIVTVVPEGDFSFREAAGATTCLVLHADFFVDMNGNGVYDAPPVDHAWRVYTMAWEEDDNLELSLHVALDPVTCVFH